MRKVILSCAAVVALTLTSCVATGVGVGAIYTDVAEGEMVTCNQLGSKVGTGSETGILGLVSIGDASIESAAKSAGIKKVSHVDCKKTSILGIYSTYKVFVYGE